MLKEQKIYTSGFLVTVLKAFSPFMVMIKFKGKLQVIYYFFFNL